jgi:hypothetical protein
MHVAFPELTAAAMQCMLLRTFPERCRRTQPIAPLPPHGAAYKAPASSCLCTRKRDTLALRSPVDSLSLTTSRQTQVQLLITIRITGNRRTLSRTVDDHPSPRQVLPSCSVGGRHHLLYPITLHPVGSTALGAVAIHMQEQCRDQTQQHQKSTSWCCGRATRSPSQPGFSSPRHTQHNTPPATLLNDYSS